MSEDTQMRNRFEQLANERADRYKQVLEEMYRLLRLAAESRALDTTKAWNKYIIDRSKIIAAYSKLKEELK